jgi:hypothetical protein
MSSVEVPNLRQKLNKLYDYAAWPEKFQGLDGKPESRDQHLARCLSLKPQNIPTYCYGQDGIRAPNMLPDKHIHPICKIFGVPMEVLLGPLDGLEDWTKKNPYNHLPIGWRILTTQAETWEGFALRRKLLPPGFLSDHMGLIFPPENEADPPLPIFTIAEEVEVWLNLPATGLTPLAGFDQEIGIILVAEDLKGVSCLCPSLSKHAPQPPIRVGQSVRFPATPGKWNRITGPIGPQAIYVILMPAPLPKDDLYHCLEADKVDQTLLDRLARGLAQREPTDYRVLKYPYQAIGA